MDIDYRDNAAISVEAAIDLYKRSTLGERRPVDRLGFEHNPRAWMLKP